MQNIETSFSGELPDIRAIGFMLFDPVWAERDHPSGGMEVLHVIKGTVRLHLGGEIFEAGSGETLLIPSRSRHRDEFDTGKGLEVYFCSLSWSREREYFRHVDNRALLSLPPHRKAEIAALFDRLRAEPPGFSAAGKLLARARLFSILAAILQGVLEKRDGGAPPEAAYGAERRRALMLQAQEYLQAHYAECVALDDIAAALGVSAYYLSHLFREQSDLTLFAFLTAIRMEKSRALLLEGGHNIAEAGRAVGYEDANYFSKAFRKYYGRSPRALLSGELNKRRKGARNARKHL